METSDCVQRYSQIEKEETFALVWAIVRLNTFIFGKQFDLVTGHKILEFLFKCP